MKPTGVQALGIAILGYMAGMVTEVIWGVRPALVVVSVLTVILVFLDGREAVHKDQARAQRLVDGGTVRKIGRW